MSKALQIKTRIAPSPTGFLHIGTARTALFNYLFAKREKGEFLLRIEDTDLERSDKKYEDDIIEGLKWLGIDWDGEITKQSKRLDLYEKCLTKLLDSGAAFYCAHSEEELETEQKEQMANKISPKHACEFRNEKLEIGNGKLKTGIVRFKNDATEPIVFEDEIRGKISFDPKLLGDFSLAKNTKIPLYNFAVVVDDAEMAITHVIRGEDHISNTPKQILIQDALGFPRPRYAHLPLILGSDRSKLSKRHGATSVIEYREAGYLPEAFFNFMALLGWRPEMAGEGSEIYTKDQLIEKFSLDRVQKAGAIFDVQKLDWMNGEYIRQKSPRELLKLASPYLGDLIKNKPLYLSDSKIEEIIKLEQPRLKKLSEIGEKIDYFFKEPGYDADLLKWKNMSDDEVKESLFEIKKILEIDYSDADMDDLTIMREGYINKIFKLALDNKDKGRILWPLRVALSGKKASPGPFEIMEILGQKTSISRINLAIDKLG